MTIPYTKLREYRFYRYKSKDTNIYRFAYSIGVSSSLILLNIIVYTALKDLLLNSYNI